MAEGQRAYSRSEVRKSPAFEVQTCFASEPYRCENYGDGRPIELTALWEHVQRLRRLPHGLDRNSLFRELSSRMGYPEWEVRQHALRVLADLAPSLPPNDVSAALDSPMLLPATVTCLGHPSAAVRRAALDALRALLVASEDPDMVVDALVIHGLDGTDPDVAMGVILGVPALLSPRLPHQGLVRLVSALARKVIHSAFHEEALDTLSKIRALVGEGQFDRFLSGFPPKYRRDFRALFRAHDVRSETENSSAETRARVKEMLASGLLNEVEEQETKRVKIEPSTAPALASAGKIIEVKEQPASATAIVGRQITKSATIKEVEEEEIDSANGSRPASAETRTEDHSVSEKGAEPLTKAETLQVPEANKEDEDEVTLSDNDRTSVDTRGKGSEGGGGTEEEGGELEDDEDSGVEGSGGRGEEGTEGGAPSPPPTVAGRVLLETEIQFSEATAITMTILEEADVASNDGDPEALRARGIEEEEFDPNFAMRVLGTSDEEEPGKIREVGRPSAGRRVRFGGEMVLQTPDSSAETLDVPKKTEESCSAENSSEDQDRSSKIGGEGTSRQGNGPFASHIPVRVDGNKRQNKNSEKEKTKGQDVTEETKKSSECGEGKVLVEAETNAEDTKVKLEAEGTEVELLVQVVSGDLQEPEVNSESPPEVLPANRVHSWEDLGIVDKSVIVDIKNKEDWQARGRGMQILKTALRDPNVSSMLYPHLPEFLFFLEPLLEDRSIPVVIAALGAVRNLASAPSLFPRLSSPAILRRLTASLCKRAAHAHVAVRAAAASAAKTLMRATGPRTLLPPLLTLASAPRAPGHRVRESALILALHALLAFPSGEFDAAEVARRAVPALADPKRRVRQAALECVAVLAQFVPQSAFPLSLAMERLRSRRARRALEAAVSARLSRRRLPVLTTDGLILYALQIPPTASRGMPGTPTGADVDWILAGTGSISSGSAMSRGHYVINRSDSPLLPTNIAQVPAYSNNPPPPPVPNRNRPDSPAAWSLNSPWVESRRNQEALEALGPRISAADQRSYSAETSNFSFVPLRAARDAQKPASSPCVGTSGVPGVATLSPWSAAAARNSGEDPRRKPPAIQAASVSSSFSSSTSSTSSASSASTTSSNPKTFGFSVLPNPMTPLNAVLLSPGKAVPTHGLAHSQEPIRLRSPSPLSGRRSRRHLAPLVHQSSTDSRPSSPTSNDSSIPPHFPAPLHIHCQKAIVKTNRWSGGAARRSALCEVEMIITNPECSSRPPSGQCTKEKLEDCTVDNWKCEKCRGHSTGKLRRLLAEKDREIERLKKELKKREERIEELERFLTPDDSSSPTRSDSRARMRERSEKAKKKTPKATGDPSTAPAPPTEELAKQQHQQTAEAALLDVEAKKETGEGVDPGPSQAATEETIGSSSAVGRAASSALGNIALAEIMEEKEEGKEEVKEEVGGGGGKEKVTPEGVQSMAHPCVPEESGDHEKEEDNKEREKDDKKGEKTKKNREKKEEMEENKKKENKRKSSEEEEAKRISGIAVEKGEEEGKKEEGSTKEEPKSEGAEVEGKEGTAAEDEDESGGKEEGEGVEEIKVEGVKGLNDDQTARITPPEKETNHGGGVAEGERSDAQCHANDMSTDLSVRLLGSSADERLNEPKDPAFTTLPPDAAFSPPPRPKHLSCSYPSGTLKLSPEEVDENAMSVTLVQPNATWLHGKDHSLNASSSAPTNGGSPKKGQTRNRKLTGGKREGRRSLGARNTTQKHSVPSAASAPNVAHRSSSVSSSLFPETLPPVKNPKEALKQAFQNMEDPDWEVAMKGLELIVRLIRYHPSYVQAELTRVIATLARQIRNLRSQVARSACQVSGELALPRLYPSSPASINSDSSTNSSSSTSLLRRALEADLEEVAAPLLHRSADTNRFLRDDCVAALDRFVAGVGPARVVGPILSKGVTHQNALVRTVTARLLATIVTKLGAERVMTQLHKDVRGKILRAGANLLMEGSLNTRTYAKQVFRTLAAHEGFDRALTQAVPTPALRNIQKTLMAIRNEVK